MNRRQAKSRAKRNQNPARQSGSPGPESPPTVAQGAPSRGAKSLNRGSTARKADRQTLRVGLAAGTVVVVALIVAVAFLRGNLTGTTASALTNPNALNPVSQMLPIGSTAPDFDLTTSSGQHVKLSDLRGHPVVLEFFAIWCPHCQNEAPILNQVDTTFAPSGEHTLSILASPYGRSYDTSGGIDRSLVNQSDLTWFQNTFKVQHPMLIDPNFGTVNRYGANSYPTIYVVDGNGIIRFAQSGDVPYQDIANALTQLQ